ALFCVPWQWSLLSTSRQTYWIAVAILLAGAFVCVGGAIYFQGGHPTHRWFAKRLRFRPGHSLRDEVARIWGLLCNNKMLVASGISAALIAPLAHCVIVCSYGMAVGSEILILQGRR